MFQEKDKSILLSIVWPFAGLVSALKNWRQPWAMNAFWIVCIYMGAIQIFQPEGTTLGSGCDGGRYVMELHSMYVNVRSFSSVSQYFYDGDTNDIFCDSLTFIISRFTDNGHVFFCILAFIFGFFYSRNIWYILNMLPEKSSRGIWVLIATFFLVCPIWTINGVRMWTALQIYCYGALPYLIDGDRKKLIWPALSILVHHSFIIPIAILFFYILFIQKYSDNNKTLYILFAFYLFSLTIHSLNLEVLSNRLQIVMPSYYDNRIESYVNEDTLDRKIDALAQNTWHVAFFNSLQHWTIQILIVLSFITIRNHKEDLTYTLHLFALALLLYGFANIASLIPSGGRFTLLARMFMLPVFLLIYEEMHIDSRVSKAASFVIILLALSLIFDIRKGLESYGISLFFGNIVTAFIIDDNTPIIYLIKSIL